jgi:flagellar biosynthetic protein FliQ
MQVGSIAPTLYSQARTATQPAQPAATDPAAQLGQAAASFAETMAQGEATAKSALAGNADPHALVEALAATELAVETAVTVRDRVVEAYQGNPADAGVAMSEAIFFDTLRAGLWVAVLIALPILSAALIAGIAIGLFQALTSIQELTLTFVPKLVAIVIVFWASMGFMSATLTDFFGATLVPLIAAGG